MQPIIARFCNAKRETFNVGLVPDFLNEDELMLPKLELGDINENMLNQAIDIITGNVLRGWKSPSPLQSVQKVGSSISVKPGANQAIVDLKISKKTITLPKIEYHDSK